MIPFVRRVFPTIATPALRGRRPQMRVIPPVSGPRGADTVGSHRRRCAWLHVRHARTAWQTTQAHARMEAPPEDANLNAKDDRRAVLPDHPAAHLQPPQPKQQPGLPAAWATGFTDHG